MNVFQKQIITKYVYFKHIEGSFILQVTGNTGVLVYAEMKRLDRKLRGMLQVMTELSVERIQILDFPSWLYYSILILQIFIKYNMDKH